MTDPAPANDNAAPVFDCRGADGVPAVTLTAAGALTAYSILKAEAPYLYDCYPAQRGNIRLALEEFARLQDAFIDRVPADGAA